MKTVQYAQYIKCILYSFCLLSLTSCSINKSLSVRTDLKKRTCNAIEYFLNQKSYFGKNVDFCAIDTVITQRNSGAFLFKKIKDYESVAKYPYSKESWNSQYIDELVIDSLELIDTFTCILPEYLPNNYRKGFDKDYDYLGNKDNVLFFTPLIRTKAKNKYYLMYYFIGHEEDKLSIFHSSTWVYFKNKKVEKLEETNELYGGFKTHLSRRLKSIRN